MLWFRDASRSISTITCVRMALPCSFLSLSHSRGVRCFIIEESEFGLGGLGFQKLEISSLWISRLHLGGLLASVAALFGTSSAFSRFWA